MRDYLSVTVKWRVEILHKKTVVPLFSESTFHGNCYDTAELAIAELAIARDLSCLINFSTSNLMMEILANRIVETEDNAADTAFEFYLNKYGNHQPLYKWYGGMLIIFCFL